MNGTLHFCYERTIVAVHHAVRRLIGVDLSWGVAGASVRGARHEEAGEPNQDSFAVTTAGAARLALAVADGHGDRRRHFRSELGSPFACEAAMSVWNPLLKRRGLIGATDLQAAAQQMLTNWRERVEQDLKARPFTEEELSRIPESQLKLVLEHPYFSYGSTLVTTAISGQDLVIIQIGDGDAIAAYESGVRRLIPPKPQIGQATDSLCDVDAQEKFRIARYELGQEDPLHCLALATDGLVNSFRRSEGDEDFLQVAADLVTLADEVGPEAVERELEELLRPLAGEWSADDVTMAFAYRQNPPSGEIR